MNLILSIALIHLAACLSPGPDIFLVVRTSLRHGWLLGVVTTMGILTGVSLQIAFGLTGISYLVSQSDILHGLIALAGGTWLIILGFKGLWNRIQGSEHTIATPRDESSLSLKRAWLEGLLVNLLNPKALLFFLSLFSVMLGPDIEISIRIACGITMVGVQALAFSMVSILVAQPQFNSRWPLLQQWLDFGISLILIILGVWIWIEILISLLH